VIGGHRVAVVIPAYNEERLLPRTLEAIPGYVDEIVVVDDASQDRTGAVARAAITRAPVHVLRHDQNQGVGAAIVTGYRACLSPLAADVAVVMGADNQMHPDDMPALLWPIIHDEADYVTGDRLAWPEGWRAFPWVRLAGVVGLAAMTRWATGHPGLRDVQCGYTAIHRRALERVALDRLYPRYGFPNDLLAEVLRCELRLATRPVRPIYAEETSHLRVRRVITPLLKLTARNWVLRVTAPHPQRHAAVKGAWGTARGAARLVRGGASPR
jgi:glycosyltransferase involved in cell wall biosynthesis